MIKYEGTIRFKKAAILPVVESRGVVGDNDDRSSSRKMLMTNIKGLHKFPIKIV